MLKRKLYKVLVSTSVTYLLLYVVFSTSVIYSTVWISDRKEVVKQTFISWCEQTDGYYTPVCKFTVNSNCQQLLYEVECYAFRVFSFLLPAPSGK